jgi:hypothetical protein
MIVLVCSRPQARLRLRDCVRSVRCAQSVPCAELLAQRAVRDDHIVLYLGKGYDYLDAETEFIVRGIEPHIRHRGENPLLACRRRRLAVNGKALGRAGAPGQYSHAVAEPVRLVVPTKPLLTSAPGGYARVKSKHISYLFSNPTCTVLLVVLV